MSKTAEQEARDLLERLNIENAQSFSAGDLVELANLIAEVERLRAVLKQVRHAMMRFP
jgi:Mg2+/Co2+ transporter CorC